MLFRASEQPRHTSPFWNLPCSSNHVPLQLRLDLIGTQREKWFLWSQSIYALWYLTKLRGQIPCLLILLFCASSTLVFGFFSLPRNALWQSWFQQSNHDIRLRHVRVKVWKESHSIIWDVFSLSTGDERLLNSTNKSHRWIYQVSCFDSPSDLGFFPSFSNRSNSVVYL